jgi:hypothetical protein
VVLIVWALDCTIKAAVDAISASDANPNVTGVRI